MRADHYGWATFGLAVLAQMVTGWAIYAYVELAGADGALIGGIRAAQGLWVAGIAPLVGVWSDRARAVHGSRRPWLVRALPLYCVSFFALFLVAEHAPAAALVPAFALLLWLFDSAGLVLWVGYSSLLSELFRGTASRARAAGLRQAAVFGGMVVGIGLTPTLSALLGLAGLALVLGALGGLLAARPLGALALRGEAPAADGEQVPVGTGLARLGTTLGDRSLVRLLVPATLLQIATSMQAANLPFFSRYSLGLDPGDTSIVLVTVLGGAIPGGLFWGWLVRRVGAAALWPAVIVVFTLVSLTAWWPVGLWRSLPVGLGIALAVSGQVVLVDLRLAEVIDAAGRREGGVGAGRYQGIYMVMVRLAAMGQGASLLLVAALYGYRTGVDPGPDPATAFRVLVAGLPAMLGLFALLTHLGLTRVTNRDEGEVTAHRPQP